MLRGSAPAHRQEDRSYPLSGRVGEAVGAPHLDTDYLLHFGLERILDRLEVLIESRAKA